MFTLLLIIFIVDLVLLIPIILLQSGSGAQSGLFGSDLTLGAFGAKTSEVLVNATKWLVGIFLISAFLLGYIKIQESKAYASRPRPVDQTNASPAQLDQSTNSDTNSAGFLTNQ